MSNFVPFTEEDFMQAVREATLNPPIPGLMPYYFKVSERQHRPYSLKKGEDRVKPCGLCIWNESRLSDNEILIKYFGSPYIYTWIRPLEDQGEMEEEEAPQEDDGFVPFTTEDFKAALDEAQRDGFDVSKVGFVVSERQQKPYHPDNNGGSVGKQLDRSIRYDSARKYSDDKITIVAEGSDGLNPYTAYVWSRDMSGGTKCKSLFQKQVEDRLNRGCEYTYTAKFAFGKNSKDCSFFELVETIEIPDPPESEGWKKKGDTKVFSWPPKSVIGTSFENFSVENGDSHGYDLHIGILHKSGLVWWQDHYKRVADEQAVCISYTQWVRERPKEVWTYDYNSRKTGPTWWPNNGHVEGPIKVEEE